jgi:hypothetical protein
MVIALFRLSGATGSDHMKPNPTKKYKEINAFFKLPFVDGFACFAAHTLVIITHTRAF